MAQPFMFSTPPGTTAVSSKKLCDLLDILWDKTCLCPPDGRETDQFNQCLIWKTAEKPCQKCWLDYLMH